MRHDSPDEFFTLRNHGGLLVTPLLKHLFPFLRQTETTISDEGPAAFLLTRFRYICSLGIRGMLVNCRAARGNQVGQLLVYASLVPNLNNVNSVVVVVS